MVTCENNLRPTQSRGKHDLSINLLHQYQNFDKDKNYKLAMVDLKRLIPFGQNCKSPFKTNRNMYKYFSIELRIQAAERKF